MTARSLRPVVANTDVTRSTSFSLSSPLCTTRPFPSVIRTPAVDSAALLDETAAEVTEVEEVEVEVEAGEEVVEGDNEDEDEEEVIAGVEEEVERRGVDGVAVGRRARSNDCWTMGSMAGAYLR